MDTLAKLYDYGTAAYGKKQYTQWYDTKEGGYTFFSFKEKCDSLSKKLTQYGIGAGDKVAIAGFGAFEVKAIAERQGRNPATGETITIAATKKVTFSAAKAMKDAVNG